MIAAILFIGLILLCPSKIACLYESRLVTDIVKFVIALIVVNGHLWTFYMPESWWQGQFNYGAECVSVFLFLSAYGLMYAYSRKGNGYLKGFVRHRICRVLFPLLTAYAITLPVYSVFMGAIDWHEVLTTLWWGGPYMRYSWYVTEIVVLYLMFYVCGRIDARCGADGELLVVLLSFAIIGLAAVLFLTDQPVWYISSLPCFVLGIWYQQYEALVLHFIRGNWGKVIMMLVALAFAVVFQWKEIVSGIDVLSYYRYEYASLYVRNILFVVMIVFLVSSILKYSNMISPMWRKTIQSSYEIYLMQNACMMMCSYFIKPHWLFLICTLVMSVVIGLLMNLINKRIFKHIL